MTITVNRKQRVYTVMLEDDWGAETTETLLIGGGSEEWQDAEARRMAEAQARKWAEGGEYGDEAAVAGIWIRLDDEDYEFDPWRIEVEIAPNDDVLMRAAGADPECEHEWAATLEVEGGCDDNPGVFALGGTALEIHDHCEVCGLRRKRHFVGSQRNPGETDSVSYEMPQ